MINYVFVRQAPQLKRRPSQALLASRAHFNEVVEQLNCFLSAVAPPVLVTGSRAQGDHAHTTTELKQLATQAVDKVQEYASVTSKSAGNTSGAGKAGKKIVSRAPALDARGIVLFLQSHQQATDCFTADMAAVCKFVDMYLLVAVFETCTNTEHDDVLLVTCLKSIAGDVGDWIDVIAAEDLNVLAESITIALTRFLLALHTSKEELPDTGVPKTTTAENVISQSDVTNASKQSKKGQRKATLSTLEEAAEVEAYGAKNTTAETTAARHALAETTTLTEQLEGKERELAALQSSLDDVQRQNKEIAGQASIIPQLEAKIGELSKSITEATQFTARLKKQLDDGMDALDYMQSISIIVAQPLLKMHSSLAQKGS